MGASKPLNAPDQPHDQSGVALVSPDETINYETDGTYDYYAFAATYPDLSLADLKWKVMRVNRTTSTVVFAQGKTDYINRGQNMSSLNFLPNTIV